jgi:hypothetical protein
VADAFAFVRRLVRALRLELAGAAVRLWAGDGGRELECSGAGRLRDLGATAIAFSIDGEPPAAAPALLRAAAPLGEPPGTVTVTVVTARKPQLCARTAELRADPGMRVSDLLAQCEALCPGRLPLGLSALGADQISLREFAAARPLEAILRRAPRQLTVERVPRFWVPLVLVRSLSPLSPAGRVYRFPCRGTVLQLPVAGLAERVNRFLGRAAVRRAAVIGPDGCRLPAGPAPIADCRVLALAPDSDPDPP